MSQDALGYYQILNVDCKATVEQIKNSYRELVKIWHPDRNHSEGALEKFQKSLSTTVRFSFATEFAFCSLVKF